MSLSAIEDGVQLSAGGLLHAVFSAFETIWTKQVSGSYPREGSIQMTNEAEELRALLNRVHISSLSTDY
jgi:hypothetical protein